MVLAPASSLEMSSGALNSSFIAESTSSMRLTSLTALDGAQLAVPLHDEEAQSIERLTQIVTGGRDEARFGLIGGFELADAFFDLAFQTGVRISSAGRPWR